jgi:GTP-binding protein
MTEFKYQQVEFLHSAAKLEQLPEDLGVEVAFAGRSNAGKSSALNRLTGQRGLARASKTPGRTQLINLFGLSENCRLVDLPGYGYAKVSMEVKKRWQLTLAQYLQQRKCLKGLVLLSDIRHPLKELDLNMLDWASSEGLEVHLLLSKADKLKKGAQQKSLLGVKKILKLRYPEQDLIVTQIFSSLKNIGVPELQKRLDSWFSQE